MVSTRWGPTSATASRPIDVPPLPPTRARRLSKSGHEIHSASLSSEKQGMKLAHNSTPSRVSSSEQKMTRMTPTPTSTLARGKPPLSRSSVDAKKKDTGSDMKKSESRSDSSSKKRTSSQRRKSLSVLDEAKKSTSSRKPSHFLHGIHLETCNDVMDIPDPPSPFRSREPAIPSRTPQFSPFVDISNESQKKIGIDLVDKSKSDRLSSASRKKRSRQSLCHVAAPLHPSKSPAEMKSISCPERDLSSCEKTSNHSARKRQRRQSLVYPTDSTNSVDVAESDCLPSFMTSSAAPKTNDRNVLASPCPNKRVDLVELRNLVHIYTSRSYQERDVSNASKQILQNFGYPLSAPVPFALDLMQISSPVRTRSSKYEVISQLGPNIHRLDECKTRDSKNAEAVTECRPERNGGKIRYIHMPSNKRISPEEYEERYLLMLEEVNKIKSESWREYFASLQGQSKVSKADKFVRNPDPNSYVLDVENEQESVAIETEKAAEKTCGENSDTQHLVSGKDSCSKEDENLDSRCKNNGREMCSLEAEFAQVADHRNSDGVARTPLHNHQENGLIFPSASTQQLLPLPSRNHNSSDPDVARAEKKLWETIDSALEIYSQEVLAIRAKKLFDALSD